jgi:hypothetical protein
MYYVLFLKTLFPYFSILQRTSLDVIKTLALINIKTFTCLN